jgi:hypothetical protein
MLLSQNPAEKAGFFYENYPQNFYGIVELSCNEITN